MLEECLFGNLIKIVKDKVNFENAATYHQLAKKFCLSKIADETFCYIERCFTSVAKSNSFLELDYFYVKRVLSSSALDVTSEIQILKAANAW